MIKYPFFVIFMLFASRLLAQQTTIENVLKNKLNQFEPGLPVNEVINHIGSEVYIIDSIYRFNIVNEKLMYLYVGGNKSNPKITIIVKGTDQQLRMKRNDWTTGLIHVTGKATLFENKPAIIVTSGAQLGTQIQI